MTDLAAPNLPRPAENCKCTPEPDNPCLVGHCQECGSYSPARTPCPLCYWWRTLLYQWTEVLFAEEQRAIGPHTGPYTKPLAVTAGAPVKGKPILLGSIVSWSQEPEVSNVVDGFVEYRGLAADDTYGVQMDLLAANRRLVSVGFTPRQLRIDAHA